MAVVTIYRLAEEILDYLSGDNIPVASSVSIEEIKVSIGQVANSLLKMDYFQINGKTGETIPNGAMIGLYEGNVVSKWKNVSKFTLPVKPIKLPRNMGVWSVFLDDDPRNEFIPLQMGQWGLLQSQPLLNDLMGQVGYEVYGNDVIFTRDISVPNETVLVSTRLVVMDISTYGDYDPLPILPEMEWQIKKEVIALFAGQQVADKLIDSSVKQQDKVSVKQQSQN